MGRGQVQGSQAETSGTQGLVYSITPQTEPEDQSIIRGMFLLTPTGKSIVRFYSICMCCVC